MVGKNTTEDNLKNGAARGQSTAPWYKNFDIDIAIEDGGICKRQRVNCLDCYVGKFLRGEPGDDPDLCNHKEVLVMADFVKKFSL